MNKFGPKANKEVANAIHEYKQGTLKSSKPGDNEKSREQAVTIGLNKARKKGAKAPKMDT